MYERIFSWYVALRILIGQADDASVTADMCVCVCMYVCVCVCVCVCVADLIASIGPRTQFEKTRLNVQWEIFNVNVTGRLVGGRWLPGN